MPHHEPSSDSVTGRKFSFGSIGFGGGVQVGNFSWMGGASDTLETLLLTLEYLTDIIVVEIEKVRNGSSPAERIPA
jgi:hypothetical protein